MKSSGFCIFSIDNKQTVGILRKCQWKALKVSAEVSEYFDNMQKRINIVSFQVQQLRVKSLLRDASVKLIGRKTKTKIKECD